ncbi:MAG TPA: hypothetical protein VJ142_02775 [Candidatus Nanoarchaeia archaeon]|nr:hypothetical protein [Candidatus Nanoarchaeia archaeon]
MKKILLGILLAVLLLVGVFAAVTNESVGEEVSTFVQDFVSKRGIAPENVKGVSQVDFNALPKEVNIENVGDSNLAIYQVDYSENNQDKKVFVITYSVEKLLSQGDIIVAQDKRNFLDFGFSGVMSETGFLETSTGVETSEAKGYVMVRDGSITAVSTNLEIIQSNPGQIEIVVLKNGEPISFGNTISTDSLGVKKDYDVQARETVNFQAGDVISVVAKKTGEVSWRDVITIVEITTVN